MVSFTEGFQAGKGNWVTECSRSETGEYIERKYRMPVPQTAFLTVKSQDVEMMIHKCPPGRKDYLIQEGFRNVATVKIQGVVAESVFKELENGITSSWGNS